MLENSIETELKNYPALAWLEESAHSFESLSAAPVFCLYTPDYHANRYQRNLYRAVRREGHACHAVDAADILALPNKVAADEVPRVLHQHWLKEIFSGVKADSGGYENIRRYLNKLRYLQSKGTLIVWTVHNLLDHDVDDGDSRLNLSCLREMAALADLILVHTSGTTEQLQKLIDHDISDRTKVLPHPLYDGMLGHPEYLPLEYRARRQSSALKILLFGLLRPYKGGADLLQVFLQLIKHGELDNSQLIIAGGNYDPELKALLDDPTAPAERIVTIDRRVSDCELASLCREADVAVMPYRKILTSGSWYQATTFELPCVVPDIGMFCEVVEDGVNGLKYSPGHLATALLRAASLGPEGLSAIGRRALESCEGVTERAVSERFLELVECALAEHRPATVGDPRLDDPDTSGLRLSFCIPVMNRLDDLKATLAKNLDDNRESVGRVEFIVLCFDRDESVRRWIESRFPNELEEGYLRFHQADPLAFWHFGRAKNSFGELMKGRIYASLDGDNFTGYRGGEHIIEVFEQHDYRCVFHQFQGEWGDGTCGRVSLSREDYLDFGYDESFLPRQWDEMDAMLSTLVQRRDRTYVCYRGKSIIDKSQPFRRYLEEHGYFPRTVELDPETDPLFEDRGSKSVGHHDNQYVEDDPSLRLSSVYNHLQSFFKNSDDHDLTVRYVQELVDVQREMIDLIDPARIETWVLERRDEHPLDVSLDDIVVMACVKNEADLEAWYRYYRDLGVTRFLIIDDHSDEPVESRLRYDDVHVWRPKVGKFRYAKVFWIEILLANYCCDAWCLTIDADEFLALPEFEPRAGDDMSDLRRTVESAKRQGHSYFCGFLLDMVPGPDKEVGEHLEWKDFDHYQFLDNPPEPEYLNHNTVRWSYGRQASWAHAIDVRYRMNRSLDSLRKFPIIRYRSGMHLNQGFHDLIIDGQKRSAVELERPDLIPVKHYKLWSMLSAATAGEDIEFAAYHHETQENLRKLVRRFDGKLAVVAGTRNSFPFLGYALVPVPASVQLSIRFEDRDHTQSDAMKLERKAPLLYQPADGNARIEGLLLMANSPDEAIDSARSLTPFSVLVDYSTALAILSTTGAGQEATASNARLSHRAVGL